MQMMAIRVWFGVFLLLWHNCILEAIHNRASTTSKLNSNFNQLWKKLPNDDVQPTLTISQKNITTTEGSSVILPCNVVNLKDRKVSWIRERDLTILAFDGITYTSDRRFKVIHNDGSHDWRLEIRKVLLKDEGFYDCQVNTYPKISAKVHLRVVPSAVAVLQREQPSLDAGRSNQNLYSSTTLGQREGIFMFWKNKLMLEIGSHSWIDLTEGSNLNISCTARIKENFIEHNLLDDFPNFPEEKIIWWSLNDISMDLLFSRTEYRVLEEWKDPNLKSFLTINSVEVEDSGKLSCRIFAVLSSSAKLIVRKASTKHQSYKGSYKTQEDKSFKSSQIVSAVSGASRMWNFNNNKFVFISIAVLFILLCSNIILCIFESVWRQRNLIHEHA